MNNLLHVHEAANLIGISRTRLLQLADRGEIQPFARTPSGWRLFKREDVEFFAHERKRRLKRLQRGNK